MQPNPSTPNFIFYYLIRILYYFTGSYIIEYLIIITIMVLKDHLVVGLKWPFVLLPFSILG